MEVDRQASKDPEAIPGVEAKEEQEVCPEKVSQLLIDGSIRWKRTKCAASIKIK